jgi:transcriptional regulator with XRE-family HTH domain
LSGVYQARQEYGGRLRRLREEAGLNGKQLAERLGWSPAKLSKIETGKQAATADDILALTAAVEAAPEVIEELIADLRNVRFEYAAWTRQLRSGFAARQHASVVLERSTTHIRAVQPTVIPGLLQTPDYARHLVAGEMALRDMTTDAEEALRVRVRRQEVLYEPDKRLQFLVTEAALRHRPCPSTTMRGQLDRLIVLAGLDSVELAVIPFTTRLPFAPAHGFWIFDTQLVLVETVSAELSLRDPDDVALYMRYFELLWEVAEHGDAVTDAIAHIISDLIDQERW